MTAQTFGDPASFAIRLTPLERPPADPDLSASATWAGIELWALGRNLCRHRHRGAKGLHEAVNWPTINLARWFVHSWPEMFHQARVPVPSTEKFDLRTGLDFVTRLDEELLRSFDPDEHAKTRDAFVAGHALQSASAGAALPDVYFLRDGDIISVSWRNTPDVFDEDVIFEIMPATQTGGSAKAEVDVPAANFAEIVRDFVSWTASRLSVGSTDRTLLDGWLASFRDPKAAWSALITESGLTPEKLKRLGVDAANDNEVADFFQVNPIWATAGTLADTSVSSIAMGFRCLAPTVSTDDLNGIRQLILGIPRAATGFRAIDSLAVQVKLTGSFPLPYLHGYALAEKLRAVIGNVDEPLDIRKFLQDDLHVPVREIELSDHSIDGGCICDAKHGPIVLLNKNSPFFDHGPGERAVMAHEMCHLLFDRHAAASITVLSGPWASPRIEAKANAFAAELLLPAAGIRKFFGRAAATTPLEADVKRLASRFNVGDRLTRFQIDHRYWATFQG